MTLQGGSVDGNGGAIFSEGARLTVGRSTIRDNSAFGDGAGIYASGGVVTVLRSTVTANRAGNSGGGIAASGVLRVVNSTVSGNTVAADLGTAERGGGIRMTGPDARLRLQFATVAGNTATIGAGVDVGGGVTIARGALLAGNHGPACAGTPVSRGGNVDDDGSCGFTAAGDRSGVGPRLAALAPNGGPTDSHALGAGSPARDGVARCDAGAFEARG